MKLSEYIRNYRKANNLSLREFADRCGDGISYGYISMLEREKNPATGKPSMPGADKLKYIANGMNISLHELLSSIDDIEINIEGTSVQPTPNVQRLLDFVRQVPEEKAEMLLRVMKSILQDG